MQRFAIIGLGRFGSRLAANLATAGREVIGVDRDVAIIEQVRDRVTLAIALDATDEEALRMHGIDKVDTAVVGIGTSLEPIVLTTVTLKQIGVPRVIARTITPMSARILRQVGADEIVNPEDESADRWANTLLSPQFVKHFGLDERHSIVEMKTPSEWVGETLTDLNLRARRGLHIVAVKRRVRADEEPRVHLPDPSTPLTEDELLVIMGSDDALRKLRREI